MRAEKGGVWVIICFKRKTEKKCIQLVLDIRPWGDIVFLSVYEQYVVVPYIYGDISLELFYF